MPKILIPTPLRQFVDKQNSIELAGGTVGEVLGALTSKYADLRRRVNIGKGEALKR